MNKQTICPQCFGSGEQIDDRFEGARLRSMRQLVGLTQRDVATRANVSATYISDIEAGYRHCSIKVRQAYLDIEAMAQ